MEFKDGEPNGQGTYTFSDGSKYEGEFKVGIAKGQGTFAHPDGESMKGNSRMIKVCLIEVSSYVDRSGWHHEARA